MPWSSRPRTPLQDTVLAELRRRGSLRTKDVVDGDPYAPLPHSVGTARDVLEALARRGDARRLSTRPVRYEATLSAQLER